MGTDKIEVPGYLSGHSADLYDSDFGLPRSKVKYLTEVEYKESEEDLLKRVKPLIFDELSIEELLACSLDGLSLVLRKVAPIRLRRTFISRLKNPVTYKVMEEAGYRFLDDDEDSKKFVMLHDCMNAPGVETFVVLNVGLEPGGVKRMFDGKIINEVEGLDALYDESRKRFLKTYRLDIIS